jgi:hypothetical protein
VDTRDGSFDNIGDDEDSDNGAMELLKMVMRQL